MKRIHRLILAGACSLALGIGLAACGGSSNDSSTNSTTPRRPAARLERRAAGPTATTGGTAAGNTSNSSGGGSGGGVRLLVSPRRLAPGHARCTNSTISSVGAPGVKTSATPSFFSSGMSSAGIVPPTVTTTSSAPWSESSSTTRGTRVMWAPGEDREADRVGVLLDGGLGDLLGRLVQARVDHLHAGVAQRASDDLRPAVVAVQAGLGDDNPDFSGGVGRHY